MKTIRRMLISGLLSYFILSLIWNVYTSGWFLRSAYGSNVTGDVNVASALAKIQDFLPAHWIIAASVFIGIYIGLLSYHNRDNFFRMVCVRLLRLSMSILLICAIIFSVYTLVPLNENVLYNAEQYHEYITNEQELPEISVEADSSYQTDIDQIESAIQSMPQFLLNRCEKIIICDSQTYLAYGDQYNISSVSGTAAFSKSDDLSIYIRITAGMNVSNTYDQTIAHELSHIYDFSMHSFGIDPYGCSDTDEFSELYKKYGSKLTAYGATDQHEFFAEAGSYYILYPDTLRTNCPEVYTYFDNIYGPYM
ncbi:zinc-dependent peptidase [Catenisphaera adipataccumulans]|jgi:hypothetical protein|uniref:Anthrax toxin lethal/endema factor N-/C-terminal domain-containing protein n=1 Tax=Catenisphaera adipataccumulans TaxID=700500 RepID=A0A7W8CZJ0_9FIRM|nr:zinc-dependent peptidase [Catenisphaera adipataccumulans]MBB5182840.1 hypothetical protein [Catenisphaera adipataccumulans]